MPFGHEFLHLIIRKRYGKNRHFYSSPVQRYADENVAGQKQPEYSEEGEKAAEKVAGPPHDRRGPPDFQGHHQTCHLCVMGKIDIM